MKRLRSKYFFIYYHSNTTGRIVLNIMLWAFLVLAYFNSKADDMYLAVWIVLGLIAFWYGKSWLNNTWYTTKNEWQKKKFEGEL